MPPTRFESILVHVLIGSHLLNCFVMDSLVSIKNLEELSDSLNNTDEDLGFMARYEILGRKSKRQP